MGKCIVIAVAAAIIMSAASASVDLQRLSDNIRFCPSWAEAHERTLAILNNDHPPYSVKWKGCILVKRGTKVDIVDHDDSSTEIAINGKHWFADG